MDYAGKLEGASHESSGLAMRQAVPDSNAVMAHHYWSNSSAGDSVVTIKDETASLEHHPSNSLGPALHSTGFAPWSPTHTTTSGSVPQNNSSLQPKAKPLGRIKTLVRLLLVLIDLVTDLIFLVECYRPSTLSCLTYSAFPENEKKRQRLHNGILYGAWACASAAAVEFIVLCLLVSGEKLTSAGSCADVVGLWMPNS